MMNLVSGKWLVVSGLASLLIWMTIASCSNEDFEKTPAVQEQEQGVAPSEIVACFISDICYKISETTCTELGGRNEGSEVKCVDPEIDFGFSVVNGKWLFVRSIVDPLLVTVSNVTITGLGEGADITKANSVDCETPYKISFRTSGEVDGESFVKVVRKDFEFPCVTDVQELLTPPVVEGDFMFSNDINFTCSWAPAEVEYGSKATLSLNHNAEDCTADADIGLGERTIMAPSFPNEEATVAARGKITCGGGSLNFDCQNALKINPKAPPAFTGNIKLEPNLTYANSKYFSIGASIEDAVNLDDIVIADETCVKSWISEGTTEEPGEVNVIAIATCSGIPFPIDNATATVVPDVEVGDCELGNGSTTTMQSNETLTIKLDTANVYGRCDIEYTFDGTNWDDDNTLSLSGSGNKTLSNIKARCGQQEQTCPTVKVASYYFYKGECSESLELEPFPKGTTILEFACTAPRINGRYWFRCEPKTGDFNFEVKMDGYTYIDECNDDECKKQYIERKNGNNAYVLPRNDTEPMEDGIHYKYPKRVIVETEVEELTCSIW